MNKLYLHVIVLTFCSLFALTATASAIELPKGNPIPGGIAIIDIQMQGNNHEPTVYFQKKRVTLIPSEENVWKALVGIPLSTQAGKYSVSVYWATGSKSKKSFEVGKFEYPVQKLTIKDKNKVNPNEKEMRRIWKETARIQKAKTSWLKNTPTLSMKLPVVGRLSSQFGLKRFFNEQPRNPHSGLDIAAKEGTPIFAPAGGTVVETGDFFFSGKCVFIDHGRGVISFYGHMSQVDVKAGQKVKQGERLGAVGETGRVTGAHLHWAIGLNGTWVDPNLFLKK